MTQDEAPVVARDIRKRYGDFTAVDGISFEIRRGECFGFLGPNGAGKTTTMRMIYRASPLDSGSLRVLGHEALGGRRDREIKRRVGVVPQDDNLDQELTVRENLEVFTRFYGLSRDDTRKRVDELLEFVNLRDKQHAKVDQLSGGMKRRALIARGLVGDPRLLVLDEPTTGLDPQARQNLWDRLFALKRREATLILTTHYMDEAEQLCDRLVIMDQGRIVVEGAPARLISDHLPPQVVEVKHAGELPESARELGLRAGHHLRQAERHLFYVADGERELAEVTRMFPGTETRLRATGLEDVFLKLTGRRLED